VPTYACIGMHVGKHAWKWANMYASTKVSPNLFRVRISWHIRYHILRFYKKITWDYTVKKNSGKISWHCLLSVILRLLQSNFLQIVLTDWLIGKLSKLEAAVHTSLGNMELAPSSFCFKVSRKMKAFLQSNVATLLENMSCTRVIIYTVVLISECSFLKNSKSSLR
jgi:hypothetical protein